MRKLTAAAGSAVFLVAAPGVVAGLVPWWLTGWHDGGLYPVGVRIGGVVAVCAGAAVLLGAFAWFVAEGGEPRPRLRRRTSWLCAGHIATSAIPCTWLCWPSLSGRR
jgi:hypothetical protein